MAGTDPAEMDAVEMFPPHVLREYALLADRERGALVGPCGDVVWMCAPRWDSGGVFSSLIGGRGAYAITPTGRFVWDGYYEEGSLIWRSRWITETGIIEALLLFAVAARRDHLGTDHYKAVTAAVAAIEARWRQPDAGIWELGDRRWAYSRLICAARLRAMATAGAATADAAAWSGLADTIVADAASDCLHPSGRWQRAPDDPRVDAALLLPAIRGALPAGDPRTVATVHAVRAELGEQGYVYRFRQDTRPPGEAEGAFTLCGFLMALAEHQQGDPLAARTWFERNRAACGPPGLFSEEYDITQRQMRGNLPQAFVHALMVEAAVRLT